MTFFRAYHRAGVDPRDSRTATLHTNRATEFCSDTCRLHQLVGSAHCL